MEVQAKNDELAKTVEQLQKELATMKSTQAERDENAKVGGKTKETTPAPELDAFRRCPLAAGTCDGRDRAEA